MRLNHFLITALGGLLFMVGLAARPQAHLGHPPGTLHPLAMGFRLNSPDQRIGGVKREGRVGDYQLLNGKIAAVIEDIRPSSNIYRFGGLLTDVGRLAPSGRMDYNLMDEMIPIIYPPGQVYTNLRVFVPQKIEVLKTGQDGGAAVVRVSGEDGDLPYIVDVLKGHTKPMKLKMVYDYELAPEDTFLTVRLTISNPSEFKKSFHTGVVYFLGDGLHFFTPGGGYDREVMKQEPYSFLGLTGPNISYGLQYDDNPLKIAIDGGAIKGAAGEVFTLEPGQSVTLKTRLSVGTGDVNSVLAPFLVQGGTVLGRVAYDKAKMPYAEVYAFAEGAAQPHSLARTDATGAWSLSLPPGKWTLKTGAPDTPLGEAVTVDIQPDSTQVKDLTLSETGWVSYTVKDNRGRLIPATLAFAPKGAVNGNPVIAATQGFHGGFEKIVFATQGKGLTAVPPGDYTLYISRGLEYEIFKQDISLKPGAPLAVAATLQHSVDTTGFQGGDFHIHALGSTDTDDTYEDKVASFAATGLEIPIATDHDHHSDYAPYVKKLNVTPWMKTLGGVELTTVRWGHFNGFPVKRDETKPDNGAVDWYGKNVPEIIRELRQDKGAVVVQMNHPRSKPGIVGGQGYLENLGYDPKTGKAKIPAQFTLDFDGIEVLNGKGLGHFWEIFADWSSFLNMGRKMTAHGNSDSHNAFHLEVGYPRNMVRVSTDDPAKMNVTEFLASLKKQQVVVNGGLFLGLSMNGQKEVLGKTFHAKNGVYKLGVKVQGTTWTDLKRLDLYENGEKIQSLSPPAKAGVVKFQGVLPLKPKRDAWYVLIAHGEKDLYPVYPGAKPFGFTNPFWIDTDGDGKFTPLLKP